MHFKCMQNSHTPACNRPRRTQSAAAHLAANTKQQTPNVDSHLPFSWTSTMACRASHRWRRVVRSRRAASTRFCSAARSETSRSLCSSSSAIRRSRWARAASLSVSAASVAMKLMKALGPRRWWRRWNTASAAIGSAVSSAARWRADRAPAKTARACGCVARRFLGSQYQQWQGRAGEPTSCEQEQVWMESTPALRPRQSILATQKTTLQ